MSIDLVDLGRQEGHTEAVAALALEQAADAQHQAQTAAEFAVSAVTATASDTDMLREELRALRADLDANRAENREMRAMIEALNDRHETFAETADFLLSLVDDEIDGAPDADDAPAQADPQAVEPITEEASSNDAGNGSIGTGTEQPSDRTETETPPASAHAAPTGRADRKRASGVRVGFRRGR